jgi:hypothetical protein
MDLEKIEKEIIWWNRAAVMLPIVSTAILLLFYRLDVVELQILFYIALSLYIVTAITWWWWTMKNIIYLAKVLTKSTNEIEIVIQEVKDMRRAILDSQQLTSVDDK